MDIDGKNHAMEKEFDKMNQKIKHCENDLKMNKHNLDLNKREREQLAFDFNNYKNKITQDITDGKEEAWAGWVEQKKVIDRISYAVNKQLCINDKLKNDMKMFQKNYSSSIGKMMTRFADTALET